MPKTIGSTYVNLSLHMVHHPGLWIGTSHETPDGWKDEDFIIPVIDRNRMYVTGVLNGVTIGGNRGYLYWDDKTFSTIVEMLLENKYATVLPSCISAGDRVLVNDIKELTFDTDPKTERKWVNIAFDGDDYLCFRAPVIHRRYSFTPWFAWDFGREVGCTKF